MLIEQQLPSSCCPRRKPHLERSCHGNKEATTNAKNKVAGCQTQFPLSAILCHYANAGHGNNNSNNNNLCCALAVASPVAAQLSRLGQGELRLRVFFFFRIGNKRALEARLVAAAAVAYRADFLLPVRTTTTSTSACLKSYNKLKRLPRRSSTNCCAAAA